MNPPDVDAYQNAEWKIWPGQTVGGAPRVFMEHVEGTPSKYEVGTMRMLLDALAHALARAEGAETPPAEPELDPILDAVRERRLAVVLELVVEQAEAAGDQIAIATLHTLADERDAKLADTISVQRAGYQPCGECEGQTVLVQCGAATWRQCLEQCSATSRRQPTVSPPTTRGSPPWPADAFVAVPSVTWAETIVAIPVGTTGRRAARAVGRAAQESARARGANCQSCDGGYVQCRNPVSGGRFLRRCRYCGATGVRGG